MNIVYSFNKSGYEAQQWAAEISGASTSEHRFFPFNHGGYVDPNLYLDAYSLDALYQARHAGLVHMYSALSSMLKDKKADVLMVNNCPPYHPDYLRGISLYKTLISTDDPDSTYKRNIPYIHAYNHIVYIDPAYSYDLEMSEKMQYAGAKRASFIPMGVKRYEYNACVTADQLCNCPRDIDVVYVGSCFRQKLPVLAAVKKAFGKRCVIRGRFSFKQNVYLKIKYRFPGWVYPVSFQERVLLMQRAKIGFNIHWNQYGIGNERLFQLPANGVLQICDCPQYVDRFFKPGYEIDSYSDTGELITKITEYLNDDERRKRVAMQGYLRVIRDYQFSEILLRTVNITKG